MLLYILKVFWRGMLKKKNERAQNQISKNSATSKKTRNSSLREAVYFSIIQVSQLFFSLFICTLYLIIGACNLNKLILLPSLFCTAITEDIYQIKNHPKANAELNIAAKSVLDYRVKTLHKHLPRITHGEEVLFNFQFSWIFKLNEPSHLHPCLIDTEICTGIQKMMTHYRCDCWSNYSFVTLKMVTHHS